MNTTNNNSLNHRWLWYKVMYQRCLCYKLLFHICLWYKLLYHRCLWYNSLYRNIYEIYIEQWPVPPAQAAKRVMSVANAKINVLHHLPKDTNQRKTFPWHCHELESEHEHPWDKFSKVFLKFVFCLNWPYKNETVSTLCVILKTF